MAQMETSEKEALEGNSRASKSRVTPAKNWIWTQFQYHGKEDLFRDQLNLVAKRWLWGYEKTKEGKEHLQAFVEFKKKMRPLENKVFEEAKGHWHKMNGTIEDNVTYCTKDMKWESNFDIPEIPRILGRHQLRDWQKEIVDIVKGDRDPRKIYWYWDENGNTGKTEMCRFLCFHHKAMLIGGKASDMKYAIAEKMENGEGYPHTIILNLVRGITDPDYRGLEEVKDAMFFSTKYKSGMVMGNSPHIIVFANNPPDISALSPGRFIIKKLD